MENDNKFINDKDLYTIAVLRYQEENPNLDENNLFPIGWNNNYDYKLKINIIAEAIKNKTTVQNTELYRNSLGKILSKY